MIVSLGFLLLIVVMSAVIAVIADNVGRKLGKKRMSIRCRAFSLRPKHVAQIGTALTGALVSLVTIGIVAAVSSDVRDWIVRGRAAIIQSQSLVAKVSNQKKEIQTKDLQISSQKEEVNRGRAAIASQRKELTKLNEEITRLKRDVPRLRQEVLTARSDVVKANQGLAERQKRLAAAQSKLGEVRLALAGIRQKLDVVRADLKSNQLTLTETTTQKNAITRQNTDLLVKNGELDTRQRRLLDDISRLNAARDEAVNALTDAQTELQIRQTELSVAEGKLRETQSQLQQATLTSLLFRDISKIPRIAAMTYRMQEEVTRLPLDEGMSRSAAEATVDRLLRMARLAVIERGAKPNDEFPEAGIFEHRDPTTERPISGEQIRQDVIRRITGQREPMVIVAYSSLNAFKGEPVSLDVAVFPNPVVYRKGQKVAESQIDARKDDTEIFRQLTDFLGSKVREQARQDHMIPRTGSDEAFGSVDSETMLRLMTNLRAAERSVRIIALADADTRAGDALKLTFQIR